MRTPRIIFTIVMLVLAFLLFITMESSTYQMHPDLRIIAEGVYSVGIVVAMGLAGLPWIFDEVEGKK
ncbi:MAG: hypothetical protein OEW95_07545 [Candidatus Bathyarchaeota archaeon]|nr:hypothetical protein [Candidatus Bathyarchaeota archaeon]